MVQQITTVSGQPTATANTPMETWALARKRADDYLKLHRLPADEREQLLSQVARKLTQHAPCAEQELIKLFLQAVREEMAVLQNQQGKSDCRCDTPAPKQYEAPEPPAETADIRTKTGPQFQRSSIRVAPLQAISLRLARLRHH